MRTLAFSAVLAMMVVGVTRGQQCMQTLVQDVSACFRDQGLTLNMTGQQDASRLMQEARSMDPATQCKHVDVYQNAIGCSLDVLRECLKTVNMEGSIPDTPMFRQGMQAMCDRQHDFDSECFKRHHPHILQCGEQTVQEVVQRKQESESLNINDIICLSTDVNYDCSRLHLQDCRNATLDIYLQQLTKYQVPAACVSRPPGRAGRQSYVNVTGGATSVLLGSITAVASLVLHLFFRQ